MKAFAWDSLSGIFIIRASPQIFIILGTAEEMNFIQPEGNRLNIYEAKRSWQKGGITKNIAKFHSLAGVKNIKTSTIITSSERPEKIGKNSRVTNCIAL